MKPVKLVALAFLFVMVACSDSTTGRVSFSLTARNAASPAPSAAFSSATAAPSVTAAGDSTLIVLGNDSVIVRTAQLVVRKVELKRSEANKCRHRRTCQGKPTLNFRSTSTVDQVVSIT